MRPWIDCQGRDGGRWGESRGGLDWHWNGRQSLCAWMADGLHWHAERSILACGDGHPSHRLHHTYVGPDGADHGADLLARHRVAQVMHHRSQGQASALNHALVVSPDQVLNCERVLETRCRAVGLELGQLSHSGGGGGSGSRRHSGVRVPFAWRGRLWRRR